ncbi:MAG TPA: glycerate kinase [Solirubrobacteraceae bacterium]|jgi:glycerate kinase
MQARADAGLTALKIPQTVLIAPDSFKGSFSALEVAQAVGDGLRAAGHPVELCPVADGGEGTLDVLVGALGGELRSTTASDPLGRPIEASVGLCPLGRAVVGVVETAAASGLGLVNAGDRDPVAASTYGTGELIMAALDAGADEIYLGVGGSATTDGGSGALRAIEEQGGLQRAKLTVLCDVRTPFEDAARVFGPQKGAGPGQVRRLTARLGRLARTWRRDPRGVPLTGAAGGLSGGLWAALGAELVPGAAFVLDRLDFDSRMRAARAVVTGEGRLDQQSLAGKALSEVATRARQSGVPCYAIVGRRELNSFGIRILDLQSVLEAGTAREIRAAAKRLGEVV